jgi:hypothetical protein
MIIRVGGESGVIRWPEAKMALDPRKELPGGRDIKRFKMMVVAGRSSVTSLDAVR